MDRDIEPDPRERSEPPKLERSLDRARELETPALSRERETVLDRNRVWQISQADVETLLEIGRFRTIAAQDLLKHQYQGHLDPMRDDLKSLSAQGLIQQRRAPLRQGRGHLDVVVLTKAGKRLLERDHAGDRETLYAGFVKRTEVAHDAAIYRMFHAERRRLEREGGTIRRIVLDYELKRLAYSPLAKANQLPAAEFAKRQAAVAKEYGLSVVKGRLVLPDLRIEYVTREGSLERVDLELATEHYHGSHLAAKAQAGFRFYAADGSAAHLTRVLEERDITASILSL